MTTTATTAPHPAKYGASVLATIGAQLDEFRQEQRSAHPLALLDPFAGVGRIHDLASDRPWLATYGIELEPEWAHQHPRTEVGNALDLPFEDGSIDVIATSVTYGNRMADHHEAKDNSRRMTYTHQLGRKLSPQSSASMQWGEAYRNFHLLAWEESLRVMKRRSCLILNIANHLRTTNGVQRTMRVAEWHFDTLTRLGLHLAALEVVPARSMKFGANSEARIGFEYVARFNRGDTT